MIISHFFSQPSSHYTIIVITLEGGGGSRPEQDNGSTTPSPHNSVTSVNGQGLGSTSELWPNGSTSNANNSPSSSSSNLGVTGTASGGLSLSNPETLGHRRTSDGTMTSNNNNDNNPPRNNITVTPSPRHAPMLESHSATKASSQRPKGSTLSTTNAKKASERARARWAMVRSNLKHVIALKAELNKYTSITDRRKRLEKILVVDDALVKESQQEILGDLGVGEHAGSHAFLRNVPHTFSVVATQPCRYYTLQLSGRWKYIVI